MLHNQQKHNEPFKELDVLTNWLLFLFLIVVSDGKLYDAYVSFLQPKSLSVAQEAEFALQILPEELERQQGYSLYIRGRDDSPGEGCTASMTHSMENWIIKNESKEKANVAKVNNLDI